MSPVVGNILVGIAIIVGAAGVLALLKFCLAVRDNTSTVQRLAKAMDDHMAEKDDYRERVDSRFRDIWAVLDRLPRRWRR